MLKKSLFTFFYLALFFFYAYSQDQGSFKRDLDAAQALVTAGRSAEALPMLEKLEKISPDNRQVFFFLSRAYLDTKAYDKLENLLKTWLEKHPGEWATWAKLGDLYLKTGEKTKADESFKQTLKLSTDTLNAYHLVAATYLTNKEMEKGIETYKQGIKKLGNPPVLLRDLANIYEAAGDWTSSLEYYFAWAKADTTAYPDVERKIMQFIESGEKPDQLESGVKKLIELEPKKSLGYKLYGDLKLKKGEMEQAFEFYKTADVLSSPKGENLLLFARTCLKRKSYELSLRACHYLESICQSVECSIESRLISSSSLAGLQKYDEALSVYQKLAQDFPIRQVQAQAYFQMGNIYLDNLKKKGDATIWYRKILPLKETSFYPGTLIKLGEIYLLNNQLDSAIVHYEKSLKDPIAQPDSEELCFRLADVRFYKGDLEESAELYQKIINDFPKGMFVNNSLERLNLIKDNLDMNRPFLKDFSKGLLLEYQGNFTEAEKLFEIISQAKVSTLSDAALMEKSALLRKQKDFKSSISEYQSLSDKFPESPYLALALKSIGDIYQQDLGDIPKAKETYELFLKKFPTSLYVQEVREKLKVLSPAS
ncbi:MAG TPA: tetratricopeptide repeat protein [Terriglobales bacterium]|nr:tetratricopeptide repeat protein [Terriglobales bacterium]